ncbi:MAG: siroheme synthase CysG [Rhodobacteraceae bacterium]|nr:siroheme synthase CysG [Paracoccaceae bacterium]
MTEYIPIQVGNDIIQESEIVRYYPIFADLAGQTVVVSGAGDTAACKLRLLLKSPARILVYGADPIDEIVQWHSEGQIDLVPRRLLKDDQVECMLFYAANEDEAENLRVLDFAKSFGVLVNMVDVPEKSQFITPAIVDRGPVTVAIGTEGTAPVLARRIKAAVEKMLPAALGQIALISGQFRHHVARLSDGKARRAFWETIFPQHDPFRHAHRDPAGFPEVLNSALNGAGDRQEEGCVMFVGAGPGDPELLVYRARREIDRADVVLHDRLVPKPILELARREARIINVGKSARGGDWQQDAINRLMVDCAGTGLRVVRLKSGDPVLFGRLDEETDALEANGIRYRVIPGITSASAAAATAGRSLTRRHRNSSLRLATGHDLNGFTELDWKEMAKPNAVTAVYMGRNSTKFIRGRMLMHGADAAMPVTVVANASRPDEAITVTTIGALPDALQGCVADLPVILLLGLSAGETRSEEIPILAVEQV